MIKKNYKLFLTIFIFSLITYTIFLQPHFVHDTYDFYASNYSPATGYLQQGRPFTFLFTCLLTLLNFIPHSTIQFFSVILGIIFLSISSCILYNMMIKRVSGLSKDKRIILTVLSQLSLFSLFVIEWMMFFETCVMCLGAMFSIIGTYYLIEKKHNFKSTLFYILSVFCYQPAITIGGSLIPLFYLYDNKDNNFIKKIKDLIVLFIPYLIALVSNYLFMKLLYGNNDIRSANPNIISNIIYIIKNIYVTVIKTYNFYPFMFIPLMLIISIIIFIYYNKKIYILNFLLTLFILWFISILPAIMMNSSLVYVIPRTAPFIPNLVIYSFIMILLYNNKCFKNNIFILLIGIVFITNITRTISIQNEAIKNNIKDIQVTNIILDKIEEYEISNHKTIKKILLVTNDEVHLENKGLKNYSDVSLRALALDWTSRSIFNYVTSRNFEFGYSDNNHLFENYYANDFSLEQLVFIDNTLYIYTY